MWRACLFLIATSLTAQDVLDLEPGYELPQYDRFDIYGAISPRYPDDKFDSIKEVSAFYFQNISPTTHLYYNLATYNQQEGTGTLGSVGFTHDWCPSFYTFSTLSAGTRTDILPRIEASTDFYTKCGPDKCLVIPIGVRYVSYWSNQRSLVLSTGLLWYLPRWVFSYRFSFFHNTPGSINSGSHKATITYGEEGWQYTSLELLFGKNSYLAIYGVDPQTINQTSYGFLLSHRYWVVDGFGLIAGGGYSYVKNLYRVWRFSLGTFIEF